MTEDGIECGAASKSSQADYSLALTRVLTLSVSSLRVLGGLDTRDAVVVSRSLHNCIYFSFFAQVAVLLLSLPF